jgi:drug/metabolite transporter (DMT)-like permease
MISAMNPHQSPAAIAMILATGLLFAMMDAGTKYLGGFLSVVLVLWSRYTIQAIIMTVVISRTRGRPGFRTRHPRFQCMRGIMLVMVGVLAFFGLRHMPLAEFTAIMMLSPVLVTAVSGWFLKEPVGALRWLLVWGGFLGTMAVIRPGSGLFGPAVAIPLLAMVVGTGYNLLTSRLAVLEHPHTTQFYTGLTGSLLLAVGLAAQGGALTEMARLNLLQLAVLLLLGLLGTFGHLLLVMAFQRASASTLMPFTYAQIGFAAAISWLVFRHAPDLWAWIGMVIIAICGCATAWLNMRRRPRT